MQALGLPFVGRLEGGAWVDNLAWAHVTPAISSQGSGEPVGSRHAPWGDEFCNLSVCPWITTILNSVAFSTHFDVCMTCWHYLLRLTLKETQASQIEACKSLLHRAIFPAAATVSRMPTWCPCCLDCSRATSWASSRVS